MANRVPQPFIQGGAAGKARLPNHLGPHFPRPGHPGDPLRGRYMFVTVKTTFPRPGLAPTDSGGGLPGAAPIIAGQEFPRPDSIGTG
jgi:hypothetical protein